MRSLLFIFLTTVLMPLAALSRPLPPTSAQQQSIDRFFEQYQLIEAKGFEAFAKARSTLLSEQSQTLVVVDGIERYQGIKGHIDSIADWAKQFQTGSDFQYRVIGVLADGRVKVALDGTLTQTHGDKVRTLSPQQHRWTEYFTFDDQGRIATLEVVMNLLSQSYDQSARANFSPNDVAGFIYQWFAGFDHQR